MRPSRKVFVRDLQQRHSAKKLSGRQVEDGTRAARLSGAQGSLAGGRAVDEIFQP
jgi:hypothetical protein